MYVMAKLSDEELAKLQRFEKDHDMKIIAMQEMTLAPEMLDAEQMGDLQQLEKALGKTLLAVKG